MAEKNCKKCFHYNACKEVASHSGYGDIYYTESQCKNFLFVDDVVGLLMTCSEKCKNAYSTKKIKELIKELKQELDIRKIKLDDRGKENEN